ncbi:MAG TPA: enoyl-CoA hydratase-related protein [Stellaceae bacterium]|nr:enoyl-CoA hydratase-related protein [Stellaceae bacterium]
MNDSVLYESEGGIATLTFNRPKVMNALDGDMREALEAAVDRVEADRGLRVVVLKGAGGGFMAGGDIKFFTEITPLAPAERSRRFEKFIHHVHPLILRLRRIRPPLVASVHGPVAGIGMSFLMACDLAIAAEDSFYTLAYCHIGTSPDGGSTFFLPRTLGMKRAMEVALLGERIDAKTALAWGLVNWVVPAAELGERTAALARRLASGPAEAYAGTKRLLSQSLGSSIETQLQAEAESFARCTGTEDFVEGVSAFIAKRPPKFQGR